LCARAFHDPKSLLEVRAACPNQTRGWLTPRNGKSSCSSLRILHHHHHHHYPMVGSLTFYRDMRWLQAGRFEDGSYEGVDQVSTYLLHSEMQLSCIPASQPPPVHLLRFKESAVSEGHGLNALVSIFTVSSAKPCRT